MPEVLQDRPTTCCSPQANARPTRQDRPCYQDRHQTRRLPRRLSRHRKRELLLRTTEQLHQYQRHHRQQHVTPRDHHRPGHCQGRRHHRLQTPAESGYWQPSAAAAPAVTLGARLADWDQRGIQRQHGRRRHLQRRHQRQHLRLPGSRPHLPRHHRVRRHPVGIWRPAPAADIGASAEPSGCIANAA